MVVFYRLLANIRRFSCFELKLWVEIVTVVQWNSVEKLYFYMVLIRGFKNEVFRFWSKLHQIWYRDPTGMRIMAKLLSTLPNITGLEVSGVLKGQNFFKKTEISVSTIGKVLILNFRNPVVVGDFEFRTIEQPLKSTLNEKLNLQYYSFIPRFVTNFAWN